MKTLLTSALIYLAGVAIILYLKPRLMFANDGQWKEFGLTQDSRHTWFPFWLFCIVWALLSYMAAYYVFKTYKTPAITETMKPGYYVLDETATTRDGFPKYVFIGEKNPS